MKKHLNLFRYLLFLAVLGLLQWRYLDIREENILLRGQLKVYKEQDMLRELLNSSWDGSLRAVKH